MALWPNLSRRKPKYIWRETGDANIYRIIRDSNWFAVVQLNGEMVVDRQHEHMAAMVKALNQGGK